MHSLEIKWGKWLELSGNILGVNITIICYFYLVNLIQIFHIPLFFFGDITRSSFLPRFYAGPHFYHGFMQVLISSHGYMYVGSHFIPGFNCMQALISSLNFMQVLISSQGFMQVLISSQGFTQALISSHDFMQFLISSYSYM